MRKQVKNNPGYLDIPLRPESWAESQESLELVTRPSHRGSRVSSQDLRKLLIAITELR